MAGTISLSLSQQFDVYGDPLAGGQLYLMVAGTVSTPQNGYQDVDLTIPLPNPIPLDAAGRIPQFFLADGYIKVRLQDANGVVQLASDNIMVIGPSSGGGGGGATVDGTTIAATGDLKARFGTGVHPVPSGGTSPGWVRCNGLTIGNSSASPAATERGNSDCQALFLFLWNNDASLIVVGGRGGSAAADWGAGRSIATPDLRGRAIVGMDDMGNVAASRMTTAGGGVNGVLLGAAGGTQNQTVAQSALPNVTLTASGTGSTNTASGDTFFKTTLAPVIITAGSGASNYIAPVAASSTGASVVNATGAASFSGTTSSLNGGVGQTAVMTTQPTMVATIYIKL